MPHRLSSGALRLIVQADEQTKLARIALDGLTNPASAVKALKAATEARDALDALIAALPLEIARMKAVDRHAKKLPAQIKAANAAILAERAGAA